MKTTTNKKSYLLKKLKSGARANRLRRKKSEIVIHCCGFTHEGECTKDNP